MGNPIWDSLGHCLLDTISDPRNEYVPCLEFYFDAPVPVTDTFFLCFCSDPIKPTTGGNVYCSYGSDWPIGSFPNEKIYQSQTIPTGMASVTPGFRYNYVNNGCRGGAFPIVVLDEDLRDTTGTNPPDTTGTGGGDGGGDTVGISAVTGQAAIDIAPNPTDNVTTVSSAVPLRMVEAYDVAGRLLLRQPATGRTAKVDMSGYRPGCYILKIHTSAGTAHRKLILR
ncbi:MAG: T9SS type A sorting domain-containing protein [Bacteroidales bacterium]|nr:T9SS type A sorting domain-containing protein [Bacteroidales bacterium]